MMIALRYHGIHSMYILVNERIPSKQAEVYVLNVKYVCEGKDGHTTQLSSYTYHPAIRSSAREVRESNSLFYHAICSLFQLLELVSIAEAQCAKLSKAFYR